MALKDTRSLVEGALLAAITVVFGIASLFLPFFTLLLPIPLVVLVYRDGLNSGIMSAFVASVITGLLSRTAFGALLVLAVGLVGLAIGAALREGCGFWKTLLIGSAAVLAVTLMSLGFSFWVMGVNDREMLAKVIEESNRLAESFYKYLQADTSDIRQMGQIMVEQVKTLYPVLLLFSAVGEALVILLLARKTLKKLGEPVPPVRPFKEWRLPNHWRWPSILGMVAAAGFYFLSPTWGRTVAINLVAVYEWVYAISGLALVWYYLDKGQVPTVGKVLLSILALSGPLPLFLAWLGFADHISDYRSVSWNRGGYLK